MIPAMEQTGLTVTPTHTIYTFEAAGVTLTVSFFTPALPEGPRRAVAAGDLPHAERHRRRASTTVSLLIDVDPVIAVNTPDEPVTWGRSQRRG